MYITRFVFNTKFLSILFFFIIAAGGLRFALTPSYNIVYCDQRFPFDMQKALKQRLEKTAVRTKRIGELLNELKAEYPSVDDLTITYKGSLIAEIKVMAQIPWVCLVSSVPGQKEYILCKSNTVTSNTITIDSVTSGTVIEKSCFNELVTQNMPAMTIAGKDFLTLLNDPEMIQCAQKLRRMIFNDYRITWMSKIEIVLESTIMNIKIIADVVTIHDNERFNGVERIFKSDQERYKNGIKADIRLPDQIICSPL